MAATSTPASDTRPPSGPSGATVRPRRPGPSPFLIYGVLGALAMTIASGWYIDFSLAPIWENSDRLWFIIEPALHPAWDYIFDTDSRLWVGLRETMSIAIVASAVGCTLALGVALLSSKVSAPPAVYRVSKVVMSVIRSLPDVAWALIFVAVVIGPLPGILALIIFDIGIVAKLTAESIDAIDQGPLEALDAAGANRWQRARVAIVPQVLPNFASYSLYVFELNVRASLILGAVGAGGIGQLIMVHFNRFEWSHLAAIVVVMLVVVVIIDVFSQALRKRLV